MSASQNSWTRLVALASCVLATGSWLLVIVTWGWFLTRPSSAFGEMGGMLFICRVVPLTLCAWFVGGLIALALGGYAARRIRSGKGNPTDGELANSGIFLSRVMLWGGIGVVLALLLLGFCLQLLHPA